MSKQMPFERAECVAGRHFTGVVRRLDGKFFGFISAPRSTWSEGQRLKIERALERTGGWGRASNPGFDEYKFELSEKTLQRAVEELKSTLKIFGRVEEVAYYFGEGFIYYSNLSSIAFYGSAKPRDFLDYVARLQNSTLVRKVQAGDQSWIKVQLINAAKANLEQSLQALAEL